MVNNIIVSIAVIIILFSKVEYKIKWGLYLLLSLIMPLTVIGEYRIPFDIVMFFPMIYLYLYKYGLSCMNGRLPFSEKVLISFVVYAVVILLGREVYGDYINYFTVFAAFRFLLIVHITYKLLIIDDFVWVNRLILIALSVNVMVCILQVYFPTDFTDMWVQLFDNPSKLALSGDLKKFGYISRPVGTLGSPTILGMFNCIACAYFVAGYNFKIVEGRTLLLGMFLSAVVAVISISKTAMLGYGIYFCVLCFILIIRKKYMQILMIILVPIVIIYAYIIIFPEHVSHIELMLSLFFDPNSVFNTRFGTNGANGSIVPALNIVLQDEYVIFGVNRVYPNVFVGDVLYLEQLYKFGIVGLIWYVLVLLFPIVKGVILKKWEVVILMPSLLFVGIAHPSQYWFLSAFILGISIKWLRLKR